MKVLRSLLVVLVLTTLGAAHADVRQIGPGLFEAGVSTASFEGVRAQSRSAGRQEMQNWCWAASIEMVLRFHGVRIDQDEIVCQVFGCNVDMPATAQHILWALNGWRIDASGRRFAVAADPYVASGWQLIEDLAYRWPLIVGLRGEPIGHAYVLTAVRYSVDPWGRPVFHSVVLRDPWPGSPSRQEWSWAAFESRLMFMARVRAWPA
jgi:hypothetical protein